MYGVKTKRTGIRTATIVNASSLVGSLLLVDMFQRLCLRNERKVWQARHSKTMKFIADYPLMDGSHLCQAKNKTLRI